MSFYRQLRNLPLRKRSLITVCDGKPRENITMGELFFLCQEKNIKVKGLTDEVIRFCGKRALIELGRWKADAEKIKLQLSNESDSDSSTMLLNLSSDKSENEEPPKEAANESAAGSGYARSGLDEREIMPLERAELYKVPETGALEAWLPGRERNKTYKRGKYELYRANDLTFEEIAYYRNRVSSLYAKKNAELFDILQQLLYEKNNEIASTGFQF